MERNLENIGVVGGGVMGAGIAYVLLNSGFTVLFKELNEDLVNRSMGHVGRLFDSLKKKGRITEEGIRERMESLTGSSEYGVLREADLVIEAVPEQLDVKREVFQALDRACRPEAILASNTSSLSISQLGGFTERPSRVAGMHWFNPSHVMKLVEIVPGLETSPETLETLFNLCTRVDKIPIQVKECAGFLVNRLLGSYMNEALFLLQDGAAPGEIDRAAEGAGIPMGPICLGDMVGWDTIFHANDTLFQEYGCRFAIPELLERVFQERRWGVKTDKGFYPIEKGRIVRDQGEDGETGGDLLARPLSAMINEGIRCLDEGVASREDIDRAMMVGAGMPKGPLQWADEMGLDLVLDRLEEYRRSYGERFIPSPLLKRKVAAGHLGIKGKKGFYAS